MLCKLSLGELFTLRPSCTRATLPRSARPASSKKQQFLVSHLRTSRTRLFRPSAHPFVHKLSALYASYSNMAKEVDPKRVEEITSLYKKLARTPFIEQGWVKPDLPTTVMIQYSQRDLPRNKKNRVLRSFVEGESFSFKPYPFAMNMTNVVMMEPSPSWMYLAILRSIKEKGDEDEKYLLEGLSPLAFAQIWDNGCMAAAIPTEGKHGAVYSDSFFGSLVWSSDEKHVAYIAEKNAPKTASFFSSKNGGGDDDKKPKPGSKFEMREDWGETYRGGSPVIVVASVAAEAVAVVPGIPETLSAGQVQWAPENKQLVFTGWSTEPRRLGIVHCYNRPCALYAVPIDVAQLFATKTKTENGTPELNLTTKLSLANACSRSPRFSSDGKLLVYLASNNLTTHNSASKLLTLQWCGADLKTETTPAPTEAITQKPLDRTTLVSGEERVVIDIVEKFPEDESVCPGLFLANLPNRCFIEDRKIIFSSQWRSLLVPLLVDLESGTLRKIAIPGTSTSNLNVQDVRKGVCALFDGSELNRVPFTFVGRWDPNKVAFHTFKITPHAPSFTEQAIDFTALSWETHFVPLAENDPFNAQHALDSPQRIKGIEYIITLPGDFSENAAEGKKTPLILFPHGGPHAANVPVFLISPVFFASLGYAVVNVNYRGSLGFGKNFVDALPGHVGDMDVSDCRLALEHVLKTYTSMDAERIYVMGGSHGGFLTGHLLSTPSHAQNPEKWAGGVMINAVTNMAHCVGISDIPDWCYVESGSADLKTGLTKMFEKSPIASVRKNKSPTLIVLGAADKRVPISQNVEYYYALKQQGTETRMLKYPGAGHGIAEPEQESDYLINSALWFEQHQ